MTAPTDSLLNKIQALLDKAASTSFPAEAEVFQKKAEDLMLKYSIDEATLDASKVDGDKADIVSENVLITGIYAKAMALGLMTAIGNLGTVTSFYADFGRGHIGVTIFGTANNVALAKRLFLSLEQQAMFAMKSWWTVNKSQYRGWSGMEQFKCRRSFIQQFGMGVAGRLALRQKEAGTGAELVLVNAKKRAEAFVAENHKVREVKNRQQHGSWEAIQSGRAAGANANLGDKDLKSTPQIAR